MWTIVKQAITIFVVLTILTGVIYPVLVTGFAYAFFRDKAEGSLIVENGEIKGSELLGQPFSDPKYFWPRPSATSPQAYNGEASSGSNLGPTNPALLKRMQERIEELRQAGIADPVPVDLVTASGSGLDPHISPAAAEAQIARVARARGLEENKVRALVGEYTEGRQWGMLGEPRVNVLQLNIALDALR